MKMAFVLPVVFGLGFTAVGMGLLLKAHNADADLILVEDITVMTLKGVALAVVGVAILAVAAWKAGFFGRRRP